MKLILNTLFMAPLSFNNITNNTYKLNTSTSYILSPPQLFAET